MMSKNPLNADSLAWLLETDPPGVRYLALRNLLDRPNDDAELQEAQKTAHTRGPIAEILSKMDAAGYWSRPGPGYNPKYRSTVWSIIMLAQLGASVVEDERIARACAYLLDHALTPGGQFTITGAPSGTVDCLQGNLCWAMLELGCDDPRLVSAFEWMARTVTGEGIASPKDKQEAIRYYAYKCGPTFACGVNNNLPCAWGGVKVMLALGKLSLDQRTPLVKKAIQTGEDFLFSIDPATANYPSRSTGKPNRSWWKFGFPVFYVTDLLQIIEALVRLGYAHDPRLANAFAIVSDKQDEQGHWPLEYDYTGKTWVDFGVKKEPNKWVTLRALHVLKEAA